MLVSSIHDALGGQKNKSQKFYGCSMDSHFTGLGLLRTVFGIVVACREGLPPEFYCIAGDNTAKNHNRPLEENDLHYIDDTYRTYCN